MEFCFWSYASYSGKSQRKKGNKRLKGGPKRSRHRARVRVLHSQRYENVISELILHLFLFARVVSCTEIYGYSCTKWWLKDITGHIWMIPSLWCIVAPQIADTFGANLGYIWHFWHYPENWNLIHIFTAFHDEFSYLPHKHYSTSITYFLYMQQHIDFDTQSRFRDNVRFSVLPKDTLACDGAIDRSTDLSLKGNHLHPSIHRFLHEEHEPDVAQTFKKKVLTWDKCCESPPKKWSGPGPFCTMPLFIFKYWLIQTQMISLNKQKGVRLTHTHVQIGLTSVPFVQSISNCTCV